jgi:hypothetical protein
MPLVKKMIRLLWFRFFVARAASVELVGLSLNFNSSAVPTINRPHLQHEKRKLVHHWVAIHRGPVHVAVSAALSFIVYNNDSVYLNLEFSIQKYRTH